MKASGKTPTDERSTTMTKRPMFLFTLLFTACIGLTATACETGGWEQVLDVEAPSGASQPAGTPERAE